jgi:hypothetical protein
MESEGWLNAQDGQRCQTFIHAAKDESMSKAKKSIIEVQGTSISILSQQGGDYISLTDMVRNFDGGGALIEQWLKSKDTVLFLGVWEQINNPVFNSLEFEGIKNEAGRNSFFLSAKKWIDRTGAKGLIASAGRYGGTYAHSDIALEFEFPELEGNDAKGLVGTYGE